MLYENVFSGWGQCHTMLSSHIWKLKEKQIPYEISGQLKQGGMHSQVEVEQFCLPALLEIHRNPKQNDVKKCIGSI